MQEKTPKFVHRVVDNTEDGDGIPRDIEPNFTVQIEINDEKPEEIIKNAAKRYACLKFGDMTIPLSICRAEIKGNYMELGICRDVLLETIPGYLKHENPLV